MIAVLVACSLAVLAQEPQVSSPEVLRVGHVVEVRGGLDELGRFVAQKVVLEQPSEDDALLGTVPEDQTDPLRFVLLGQPVEADERTEWKDLERASLAGKRVKVEGSWKGPRRFRAESIEPRGPGRERITARIDELRPVEGGWEARVMSFTVLFTPETEVEHEQPVASYALAPQRQIGTGSDAGDDIERDEDDVFGKGIALSGTLRLQGQIEGVVQHMEDFDLLSSAEEDRTDYEASARLRLSWTPSASLLGVAEVRYVEQYRRDDDAGVNDSETNHDGNLGETWLQWRDVAGRTGLDLTVGRQDFDDLREWIYDQNLDAVRVSWIDPAWRLDLSGATTISGGSDRDEEAWNAIAYLSNNDRDEHLAAWALLRDTDEVPVDVDDASGDPHRVGLAETSLHLGVRAIGEWVPQNEVWGEFAYQLGDRDAPVAGGASVSVEEVDVSAWAYDVGTTWSPPFARPVYFTLGYALGTGSRDVYESFRQTGYQDNNARFGGVTSFRYYGELLDPELSNLGISTLGVGARIAERTSLDLVFHTYTQDVISTVFSPQPGIEAELRTRPNGVDGDLGWELDAILGYRRIRNLDVEVVAAMFEPGDAFDREDTAYYLKVQLRYRF